MLKVGIIGAGTMGKMHIQAWADTGRVEIAGVYDVNRSYAEMLASRYSAPALDFPQLLQKADIIDVCTPTPTHHQYVIEAARAGKHIFCEKPLARTLEQGEEMLREVEKAGVKFMVGQVLRWFPEYRKAKQLIEEGAIGRPISARTIRGGAFPRGIADWYADYEKSGGVILDLIIHDFDFLRWCFGEVERVFAHSLTYRNLKHFDYTLVTLRFRSGVIGHIEGIFAYPPGSPFRTGYEIAGDKGMLLFDNQATMPLKVLTKPKEGTAGVAVPESPLAENPYYLEIEHFLTCVEEDKEPEVKPEDGFQAIKIALSALESVRVGKPVYL
ncbi:Gfo/Idh/MocA family oxidoreductase [bacterium]|nr:Gfo/Idh/MocA family oxidoreductase [bacterium]